KPAVPVDLTHQIARAGAKPGSKARRAPRRAHVAPRRASRAGHHIGGIEQIVAFRRLGRTPQRHEAVLHPEEVLDIHAKTALVAGRIKTAGPEEEPEIV